MNPLPVHRGDVLELIGDRGAYYGTDGEGKFLVPHPNLSTIRSGTKVEVLGSRINPAQDLPIFRVRMEDGTIVWLVIPEKGDFWEVFQKTN
ncbi:MAG: hypothetical protein WC243_01660 [Patescibacteria group bacterium]